MRQKCQGQGIEERCHFSKQIEDGVLGAVQQAFAQTLFDGGYEVAAYRTQGERTRIRDNGEIERAVSAGEAVQVRLAAFRPVVAGGDDFTFLIASEFAVPFARKLLEGIEKAGLGLSACAGVALVKASTPFLLSHKLAEDLCSFAKKAAKQTVNIREDGRYRSALAFHSPTGSLGEDYDDVLEVNLRMGKADLTAGPYWLDTSRTPSVEALESLTAAIRPLKGRGGLRSLKLALMGGHPAAEADWTRWRDVRKGRGETLANLDQALKNLGVEAPEKTFVMPARSDGQFPTPLFDALTLLSLSTGESEANRTPADATARPPLAGAAA
jgi:hypothetical protein